MTQLLKRIAINGLLTASILGLVGVGFAELGTMWLASRPIERQMPVLVTTPAAPFEPISDLLRTRVPLTMAGWGFAFVVVGEVVLYFVRQRRDRHKPKLSQDLKPDTAEVLLEELLSRLEEEQNQPIAEEINSEPVDRPRIEQSGFTLPPVPSANRTQS